MHTPFCTLVRSELNARAFRAERSCVQNGVYTRAGANGVPVPCHVCVRGQWGAAAAAAADQCLSRRTGDSHARTDGHSKLIIGDMSYDILLSFNSISAIPIWRYFL